MNSSLYHCKVHHSRLKPARNVFSYNIFLAYIDLDELVTLDKTMSNFSYNKKNTFSFFDKDHFMFIDNTKQRPTQISQENISYKREDYLGKNTKERITLLIKELKLGFTPEKIFLLTNLRNYGYVFNPVSFYYCFDKKGKLRALFSEVTNTYHEQKMYYVRIKDPSQKEFKDKQRKNFYISPFIDYNTDLHWTFTIPDRRLRMVIDSKRKNNTELRAVLIGEKSEMSKENLRAAQRRYPFITFMIIIWIHFQALKLYLKKVPFLGKKRTDEKIIKEISKK